MLSFHRFSTFSERSTSAGPILLGRTAVAFRSHARLLSKACLVLILGAPFCMAAPKRAAHGGTPSAASASHGAPSPWVATWGTAMVAADAPAADVSGQTLREIVHASVGGKQVRIWLSNRFGREPLHVGAAHIALSGNAALSPAAAAAAVASEAAGSDRTVTFHHLGSVTIPPGAEIVSDPVALNVPAMSNLAVSLFFPDHTMATTEHSAAQQISYAAVGNLTEAANFSGAAKPWPQQSWYFLSGVDAYAPGDSAIVAFGDSITDGAYATENQNHRWPDYLATRLAADATTSKAGVLGIVNAGIGGNRVLLDGYGPNALARVDWDLLGRSGARYVIVLEGINDIGRYATDHQPYGELAERLESALAQLAAQAHQHNMLAFAATITPYQGCAYYSEGGEQVRREVNRWIRSNHTFDGVVDFDRAVRDPANPLRFAPQYDSGDHLHPRDAGYQAMANAIDLTLFTKPAGQPPSEK